MAKKQRIPTPLSPSFREELHTIIFGAETPAGKWFDLILLAAILLSVVGFCLHSVGWIDEKYGTLLIGVEWFFTILFTIEYALRLYCVQKPLKYATSFWGIIDLLSFLPTYLALWMANTPSFVVVRSFRLLRVFRILKLSWFMSEADELGRAILNARAKIVVFLAVVLISVTVAGTLMYEVENRSINHLRLAIDQDPARAAVVANINRRLDLEGLTADDLDLEAHSKFTSIPEAMYWAIVTMTTVGYGDIVPTTVPGKIIAAMLILLGYSLIIVPTGFVSAEFMKQQQQISNRACAHCLSEGHLANAKYCRDCGKELSTSGLNG